MSHIDVPTEFRRFVSDDYTQVSMGDYGLTDWPEWLENLTDLVTLDLSGNRLSEVPDSIGALSALEVLDLSGNVLTEIPETIGDLGSLIELLLANNELLTLPESIGNLASLSVLDLANNKLNLIPSSIGGLTALTEFSLNDNRLAAIPESIGGLHLLAELDISNNKLAELPGSIVRLRGLTKLSLVSNKLTALPDGIGNLTSLSEIGLRFNMLSAIPESIGNLHSITELNLESNQLTSLPDSIGRLTGLIKLSVNDNRLVVLPESISKLSVLGRLNLSSNKLLDLPDSIGDLDSLAELDISSNRLTSLPEPTGKLRTLKELNVSSNLLAGLPESIGKLRTLIELNVKSNKLTSLPRQLSIPLARQAFHLNVDNNPLNDPLPEIVRRGSSALATYLRSLEDAVAQYEAKLLVVGEGNVGKSSLIAALDGKGFLEDRSTTHGIEISSLIAPHPTLDQKMTLRAWDFGGQDVYRITHQFYFSSRALYLLVWNARDGQERDQVENWLRRIRLRAGHDARTILVATHCEERLPELDYPYLKREFSRMLTGSFEVDSRTEMGLPELQSAIGHQAAELPSMGQMISPRWVAAREEVLARSTPHISYQEFVDICNNNGVTGPEVSTLAELMHDLGHIIYYGEDEGLQDIVVLNPEWFTKAISYVLEDKTTKNAGGILNHTRLRDIWQNISDEKTYSARYHRYFLRLMEKFDVSYRIEGDDLHSLVAQLVPHQRPEDLPWEPRTKPPDGIRSLALMCKLKEPAPGLISWLTVRHHRASTNRHWRRGVFLRHPIDAYASEALLELHDDKELTLEVRAPSPDLYFNVLRDSIEELIELRWPGLKYTLHIPCPVIASDGSTCRGMYSLEALLRWRAKNIDSAPCPECAEVHKVSFLITGFTGTKDPISREIDRVHKRLSQFEEGTTRTLEDQDRKLTRIEAQTTDAADLMRSVMRALSAEVRDCPHFFTFSPIRAAGVKRAPVYKAHYRMTLWCEQPGVWHPWDPATYELDVPRDWFIQVGSYAALILKLLQLTMPVDGLAVITSLPADQVKHAMDHLAKAKSVIDNLPKGLENNEPRERDHVTGRLTVADSKALRSIRGFLLEHDESHEFGGMRRVLAPSGDFLWVCPKHYLEYDPGLPVVP